MNTAQLQRAHNLTIRRVNILQSIIRLKHAKTKILVTDPDDAYYTPYYYEHSDGIDIHEDDKSRLCKAMIVVLEELVNEIDITLKHLGVEN